ncbi:DNA-binding transcriptional regulator, MarR family [Alteromonadaceae bacterium Bs31]|nr:DNA-binding transcriptional regulator, MarR family [Alteromonadaceae bacterium Bs31]
MHSWECIVKIFAMNNRTELLGGAIHKLAVCYQQLSGRFNRVLEPLSLNMTQMSLLTHFAWNPGQRETIGQLAEVMLMNQPAVTKAVKSMANMAWLVKIKDEHDARVTHLQVTEAGLRQLELAREQCLPILQQAFAGLNDKELGLLIGLLSSPVKNLTQD